MKTSRYTEAQILAILRQAEGGMPVAELCREHGMSSASFYKWRAKYGGMDASLISQMKAIEDENRRLKRMYADLSMQADLLKEALGKNVWSAPRLQGCRAWRRCCITHASGMIAPFPYGISRRERCPPFRGPRSGS